MKRQGAKQRPRSTEIGKSARKHSARATVPQNVSKDGTASVVTSESLQRALSTQLLWHMAWFSGIISTSVQLS